MNINADCLEAAGDVINHLRRDGSTSPPHPASVHSAGNDASPGAPPERSAAQPGSAAIKVIIAKAPQATRPSRVASRGHSRSGLMSSTAPFPSGLRDIDVSRELLESKVATAGRTPLTQTHGAYLKEAKDINRSFKRKEFGFGPLDQLREKPPASAARAGSRGRSSVHRYK